MGYILNGSTYGWVEDDIIEIDDITDVLPTFEERLEAVEGGIVELAEVLIDG